MIKKTKTLSLFLFILFISLFTNQSVLADKIPVTGQWNEKDIRSFSSTPPEVYLENNQLSVNFPNLLFNLTVTIQDVEGNTIFSDCISACSRQYSYVLPVSLDKGTYTIIISHALGKLSGPFEIE
ncbi:DUF3244 domain-containing protein [Parabacteroides sp. 52]|uniref:DUF3244 domain-containing protein n=1 Tax=unclassified Parabacteroides TaxID=2649774 RepID=UPI0013CFEFFE|nr:MULTISPECIES: DUF3244 domain-containing protein [unclassified Parabacteroides]MDH6533773.1 hypothetical protein [Parabacteroides sp. PM5-20]NDV54523.1 DUF3244 domain-containing protein [Parabacteroides sp. 52]